MPLNFSLTKLIETIPPSAAGFWSENCLGRCSITSASSGDVKIAKINHYHDFWPKGMVLYAEAL